jgi:hypothetical protein
METKYTNMKTANITVKNGFDLRLGGFFPNWQPTGVKGLGLTGESYIFEKKQQRLFWSGRRKFVSYDMQRGTELEPIAFAKFKKSWNL